MSEMESTQKRSRNYLPTVDFNNANFDIPELKLKLLKQLLEIFEVHKSDWVVDKYNNINLQYGKVKITADEWYDHWSLTLNLATSGKITFTKISIDKPCFLKALFGSRISRTEYQISKILKYSYKNAKERAQKSQLEEIETILGANKCK